MNWEERGSRLAALLVDGRERDTSRSEVKEVKFEQILHHGRRMMITFLIYSALFQARLQKFRKATISFVMSVRPPVLPHGTTRLPLDGFSRNLIIEYFSKICKNQFHLLSRYDKNYETFT